MNETIRKKAKDKKAKVILELVYKKPIIFLISEPIKPEQKIFKMIAKNRVVMVITKMPSEAEKGIRDKSEPTTVSPNNPPIPKL